MVIFTFVFVIQKIFWRKAPFIYYSNYTQAPIKEGLGALPH